jgi:8-oxo-dGTP diphosphatase
MTHGHDEGIVVNMTCYQAEYTNTLRESAEIEEIRWLDYSDREIVSAVDQIIFGYLVERGDLLNPM